jgi:hypothetical protein
LSIALIGHMVKICTASGLQVPNQCRQKTLAIPGTRKSGITVLDKRTKAYREQVFYVSHLQYFCDVSTIYISSIIKVNQLCAHYSRSNSAMSPASGADNAGQPMLMSQVRKVGANLFGRRSVFFCNHKGAGGCILLLT